MSNPVAERLKVCRERIGLSFRDLEARTQFTSGHISNVHSAKREATLDFLDQLAPIYKTSVQWLRDGDSSVNIWNEFQSSSLFKEVDSPETTPATRVVAVLHYLNDNYSGHLRYDDVADHLGVSRSVVKHILDGRVPTPLFIEEMSRLTGISKAWFELGSFHPLSGLGPIQGITPAELQQLLALRAKAQEVGLPIQALYNVLESLTKAEGRA